MGYRRDKRLWLFPRKSRSFRKMMSDSPEFYYHSILFCHVFQRRKKAAPEFKEKMDQLSRDHPNAFQAFPADVRRAYLESTVTEAISKEEWAAVAAFLQKDNLLGLYDFEKAKEMGYQIDEHFDCYM